MVENNQREEVEGDGRKRKMNGKEEANKTHNLNIPRTLKFPPYKLPNFRELFPSIESWSGRKSIPPGLPRVRSAEPGVDVNS